MSFRDRTQIVKLAEPNLGPQKFNSLETPRTVLVFTGNSKELEDTVTKLPSLETQKGRNRVAEKSAYITIHIIQLETRKKRWKAKQNTNEQQMGK